MKFKKPLVCTLYKLPKSLAEGGITANEYIMSVFCSLPFFINDAEESKRVDNV